MSVSPDSGTPYTVDPAALPGLAALRGRHYFTDQDYTREVGGGRIVAEWQTTNALGLMQDLQVIPAG